jgi:subtilisin family serine protease
MEAIMQLLNKRLKNSLILLLAVLLFLMPSGVSSAGAVSLGNFNNTNQKIAAAIVAKDKKSGTVVIKKREAYFYGILRAQKVINKGQIKPGELIVKYKSYPGVLAKQTQAPFIKSIAKYSGKTRELNRKLGLVLIKLPQEKNYLKAMRELSTNPNVEFVEPNYIVKAHFIPNDPYYGLQWGTQDIMAESAWSKVDLFKKASITIAILDTGVDSNHEDLRDSIVPGYDFADDKQSTNDTAGHGTHVAGIAAGLNNNGIGITGVARGCKIMPIKVLDDEGSGSDANIIEGIKYATDHGAQVINMSLGGPGESDALQEAIDYATNHGVSVVVAAGNENGTVDTPGNCKGVITVGAVERNNQRASYSNFGPELDVVAPGSDILSTYIGGKGPSGYTYFSGTSMATPFVSGVVALIKAVNPGLSPDVVTDILHRSATDLGDPGFDKYYGFGLVNADNAVVLALSEFGAARGYRG